MQQSDREDLSQRVDFDRNALDDAIEEHAGLVLRVSDIYAYAINDRDQAKQAMEAEYAKACDRARRGSEEKKTEGAIKEAAQLDKKYVAAEQAYLAAKLAADLASSLKDAYDARGKALSMMGQLFIAGYYSLTTIKGEVRRGADERSASAARAMLHSARRQRT